MKKCMIAALAVCVLLVFSPAAYSYDYTLNIWLDDGGVLPADTSVPTGVVDLGEVIQGQEFTFSMFIDYSSTDPDAIGLVDGEAHFTFGASAGDPFSYVSSDLYKTIQGTGSGKWTTEITKLPGMVGLPVNQFQYIAMSDDSGLIGTAPPLKIADITFKAPNTLDTYNITLSDIDWDVVMDWGHWEFMDDYVTYHNATVTVNPVPIPGAVLLFGSGLLGLIGIGRRRLAA